MKQKLLKVSLVGRTNAGKSTLLNSLVGETVSITNKKINTDEMVEIVARMNEQQRRQFVRTMVSKWSETAIQLANQIDQEVWDKEHYG